MLQIRQEQIDYMIEAQRQRFVRDAKPALRQEFPELWVSRTDARIERMVYDQCTEAARYGLDTAAGVYLLVTTRLRLGWDFPEGDDHAWAREILTRETVLEEDRIQALETVLWGDEGDQV